MKYRPYGVPLLITHSVQYLSNYHIIGNFQSLLRLPDNDIGLARFPLGIAFSTT
jgi:hypothetical protein